MDDNDNKMYQKETGELYCEKCDYISTHRGNYLKHLTTRKHKEGNNEVKPDNNVSTNEDIRSLGVNIARKHINFSLG